MNSNGNWHLIVRNKAEKFLFNLPREDQVRLRSAIDSMEIDPRGGDMEKMEGEVNAWRRRVGAYRIFFEIYEKERIVHLFKIKRRTSKTY